MKLKISPSEFKIVKKPEGVSPKYGKGDKVEYVHDEYGKIKGRINFSYLEEDLKNIYYNVDFPDNRLTVLKIKEDDLIFVEKYKNK